MKAVLPTSAIVVGLVLLIGSVVWATLFPPSRNWTAEKATRMTELGNQATAIQLKIDQATARPSMHAGENPAELKAQYDEVAAEYKSLYEEFKSADAAPKTAAVFLRWSGIAFVVAGGLVVFATRGA
jgi:hypothetical protein